MAQESKLGRGLGALLSAQQRPANPNQLGVTLPVAALKAGPSQPRKVIHTQPLEELAASVKSKGVLQPILVRPLPAGSHGAVTHEIVAGERRWQAAKLAGLTDIPVTIRVLSDKDAVAIALIENIQREELTSAEEARAYKRLIEEFSLTHAEVAESMGRSRAAVTNLIRLLDLPESVVALIDAKKIQMGHARALLGLEDDTERLRLAELVAERGYSVRQTENLVRQAMKADGKSKVSKRPELIVVSEVLRTSNVHAQVHRRPAGGGKLIVEFKDAAHEDALVDAIRDVARDLDSD